MLALNCLDVEAKALDVTSEVAQQHNLKIDQNFFDYVGLYQSLKDTKDTTNWKLEAIKRDILQRMQDVGCN